MTNYCTFLAAMGSGPVNTQSQTPSAFEKDQT